MTFSVDPDALDREAESMRDEVSYARSGGQWVDRHIMSLPVDGGSGIFRDSVLEIRRGGEALQRLFVSLDAFWSWSADELTQTAAYYRDTDQAQAQAADAVYHSTAPVPEETRW